MQMKIDLASKDPKVHKRLVKITRAITTKYFKVLEWLIVLSLLYYWSAITELWYANMVTLFSVMIFAVYLWNEIYSYHLGRTKFETKNRTLIFYLLLFILSMLASYVFVGIIANGLVTIYL